MKAWDNLTKIEKEKYSAYLQTRMFTRMPILILLLMSSIAIATGSIMLLFNSGVAFVVGTLMIFIAALLSFMAFTNALNNEKYLKLVFGFSSTEEGLFKIGTKDLMRMKKKYYWEK